MFDAIKGIAKSVANSTACTCEGTDFDMIYIVTIEAADAGAQKLLKIPLPMNQKFREKQS